MMVFRLLCCMVNIWKEWIDQNPDAKCLPVIFPAVLHHGKKKWKSPRTMGGMIQGGEEFSEHMPDFTCELYDLGKYPDEMLTLGENMAPGTVLYLFRHILDKDFGDIFANAMELLKRIRQKDESLFPEFLEWVLRYIYHAGNEDEGTVRGYIDQGMDKINDENAGRIAMTVAEQIEKRGETRGISSLLFSQLQERFGTDACTGSKTEECGQGYAEQIRDVPVQIQKNT